MRSYCDTGVCLYSTQYSLFGVPQSLQLILHLLYHHGEWSFSMSCQICRSQLWYCGTQAFRVLLCQNGGDAKNTTSLWEEQIINTYKILSEANKLVWLREMCVRESISNLEQSGRIADDVGELEDVGSEFLLHVTEEKHCILGGESTNACHCKNKVTEKNKLCSLHFTMQHRTGHWSLKQYWSSEHLMDEIFPPWCCNL